MKRLHPRICLCRITIAAVMLLSPSLSTALTSSIRYEKLSVNGLPTHVVTVNLRDRDVRVCPVLANHGPGTSEGWSSMIYRVKPTAAITGTYFDTRTNYPTGDIVVDGDIKWRGRLGTAIAVRWDGRVVMIPTKRGRPRSWSNYRNVVVGGPLLVWNRKIYVNPRDQGFHDPRLFAMRPRTAVGVTAGGKLLMVAVTRPVYLRTLAGVMKRLGAVRAAALDGGGSTALYYRGRTLARPNRRLTNLLAAYDAPAAPKRVGAAALGAKYSSRIDARVR